MKKIISLFLAIVFLFSMPLALKTSATTQNPPKITSETAVLIDAATGQVIYDKYKDKVMYPASITKILTGLLAYQNASMDEYITMSYEATHFNENVSHIALIPDETLRLNDAMYALGIESANDAANGIGEYIASGSIADFGVMMTDYAHSIGAISSNFTNPSGLPDDNHYTTAYDMALIAREVIKYPELCQYFFTSRYEMPATNLKEERYFNAANDFVNGSDYYEGIFMTKDGWTSDAQHTLVTAATRDGMTLIAVVMKSSVSGIKFEDTKALFDYGFANYSSLTIPNDYIELSAPERINTDSTGKFFIEKDSISTSDVSITAINGTTIDNIEIEYTNLQPDYTTETATMDINFKLGDTILATAIANGAISETRVAGIVMEQDPRTPVENISIMILFAVLGFTAVIISEVLINKRV